MTKYIIFSDDNTVDLSERVTELLSSDEGWELQGGVSCSLSEGDDFRYILFAQALVKKSTKETTPIDRSPKP